MPDEFEYRRMLEVSHLANDIENHDIQANWRLLNGASSCPVNCYKHGELYDLVGNVWQWNETPIFPYDKFEPRHCFGRL